MPVQVQPVPDGTYGLDWELAGLVICGALPKAGLQHQRFLGLLPWPPPAPHPPLNPVHHVPLLLQTKFPTLKYPMPPKGCEHEMVEELIRWGAASRAGAAHPWLGPPVVESMQQKGISRPSTGSVACLRFSLAPMPSTAALQAPEHSSRQSAAVARAGRTASKGDAAAGIGSKAQSSRAPIQGSALPFLCTTLLQMWLQGPVGRPKEEGRMWIDREARMRRNEIGGCMVQGSFKADDATGESEMIGVTATKEAWREGPQRQKGAWLRMWHVA